MALAFLPTPIPRVPTLADRTFLDTCVVSRHPDERVSELLVPHTPKMGLVVCMPACDAVSCWLPGGCLRVPASIVFWPVYTVRSDWNAS